MEERRGAREVLGSLPQRRLRLRLELQQRRLGERLQARDVAVALEVVKRGVAAVHGGASTRGRRVGSSPQMGRRARPLQEDGAHGVGHAAHQQLLELEAAAEQQGDVGGEGEVGGEAKELGFVVRDKLPGVGCGA